LGAQVLRRGGFSEKPLSSSKTVRASVRLALFYLGPAVFDPVIDLLFVALDRAAGGPLYTR
jgi:hypothetical protein